MISCIVYSSGTGSCEKYAGLLSAALHVPAKTLKNAYVRPSGEVLYIGWLMNGKIQGLEAAKAKFNVTGVVQVGMAPVDHADAEAKGREKNQVPETVAYFCRQGAFDMAKLNPVFKAIMAIINKKTVKSLEGKANMTAQEQAVYNMAKYGKGDPAEWKIDDIVAWAKGPDALVSENKMF